MATFPVRPVTFITGDIDNHNLGWTKPVGAGATFPAGGFAKVVGGQYVNATAGAGATALVLAAEAASDNAYVKAGAGLGRAPALKPVALGRSIVGKEVGMTVSGVLTSGILTGGTPYGIAIDASTGYPVVDTTNTSTNAVCVIREILEVGAQTGDTNVYCRVRINDSALYNE